ncbi:hypothetical protein GGR57DRAFT_174188 [Xylariaceae sp. FL1272]|nr:hypothetical protein GGR57DRAFT_174188 [Xylariaceae sp. FL1272]
MFRPTARLFHACKITLFTRENCGLCTEARSVLSHVWDQRPFHFEEIDIVKSENGPKWRDLYEFDVPVIHVNKSSAPEEQPDTVSRDSRLMHRFTVEQVNAKMDEAQKA